MKIHSMFLGIDGEVNFWGQGYPSFFIRLQGCNLRCTYCDTKESQDQNGGQELSIDQIFQEIIQTRCNKITITGGEPLLQEDEIHELLNRLFPYSIKVSIETNGTLSTRRFRDSIRPYDRVSLIVDYKLSDSTKMNQDAFSHLINMDWVKIVIQDKTDFNAAVGNMMWLREIGCKARFALSPAMGILEPAKLWTWMQTEGLFDVVLNVQLHKYLDLS